MDHGLYSAVRQTAFCLTVASSVSLVGVGGVGGGGGCCRSWGLHQRSLLVLAQMFLCEDARLALGLILVLRCAGCSHWLRGHSSLGPFFEVCPIYLDSLFDVVTQTADPFLAFVAEVVLIPHRFPLEFDCLGPCLRLPPTQVLDRTWQSLKTWLPPKGCVPRLKLTDLASSTLL